MDVASQASAAEFQVALMSIRQGVSSNDGSGESVSVTVEKTSNSSGAVAWRVTFLSHLEVMHEP